jgi:ferrous iron transport protein A
MEKLSVVQSGLAGKIASIDGDNRFLSRVSSIGLTVGSMIEVIRNQKKQPVLIYGRDTMIAINRKESDKITVKVTR